MFDGWSNPLYRCVEAEHMGTATHVVERHRLTGRYRRRTVSVE